MNLFGKKKTRKIKKNKKTTKEFVVDDSLMDDMAINFDTEDIIDQEQETKTFLEREVIPDMLEPDEKMPETEPETETKEEEMPDSELPLELLFKKEEIKKIINSKKEEVKVVNVPEKKSEKNVTVQKSMEEVLLRGKKYVIDFNMDPSRSYTDMINFFNSDNKACLNCEITYNHYKVCTNLVFKSRGIRLQTCSVNSNSCKLTCSFSKMKTAIKINNTNDVNLFPKLENKLPEKITWTNPNTKLY